MKRRVAAIVSVLACWVVVASTPPALAKAGSGAVFRSHGAKQSISGKDGHRMTSTLGRWRHGDVDIRGAKVKVESPWGERMTVDVFMNDFVMMAEFNGHIQVFTTFDAEGFPMDLHVEVDGEASTTPLGKRALPFGTGAVPLPPDFDIRAYEALALALRSDHSPAFLTGIRNLRLPAQNAGCALELASCLGAIAVWIVDTAAIPSTCVTAGLIVTTPICLAVIATHPLASALVAQTCGQFVACTNEEPGGEEPEPDQDGESESPITLNMGGHGFHLSGLEPPVVFDLTADGVPDLVSWTALGGDEAFLVFDRNSNGLIDHGGELFGDHTLLADGTTAEHGFVVLAEFDQPSTGGNENGLIDAEDAIFASLMLWTDGNRNGISESGELETLEQAGVISMDLDYTENGRRDRYGNRFRFNSQALVEVGNHQQPRQMSDVFLLMQE